MDALCERSSVIELLSMLQACTLPGKCKAKAHFCCVSAGQNVTQGAWMQFGPCSTRVAALDPGNFRWGRGGITIRDAISLKPLTFVRTPNRAIHARWAKDGATVMIATTRAFVTGCVHTGAICHTAALGKHDRVHDLSPHGLYTCLRPCSPHTQLVIVNVTKAERMLQLGCSPGSYVWRPDDNAIVFDVAHSLMVHARCLVTGAVLFTLHQDGLCFVA